MAEVPQVRERFLRTNLGKSTAGPQPKDVLHVPVFYTICLLSSSLTVHVAVRKLIAGRMAAIFRADCAGNFRDFPGDALSHRVRVFPELGGTEDGV